MHCPALLSRLGRWYRWLTATRSPRPAVPPSPQAATVTQTANTPLTWPELRACVPGLDDLIADARLVVFTAVGDAHFCQHECYALGYRSFPSFKKRLNQLVGFHSAHTDERVRTSAAWNLVLDHLLAALPECRRCGCADPGGVPRYYLVPAPDAEQMGA